MSRLDWFTIAVVGICLAAILFLLSRAMNWGSDTGGDGDTTELMEDLKNEGLLDDDTIDPDNMDADLTDGGAGDSAGSDDAAGTGTDASGGNTNNGRIGASGDDASDGSGTDGSGDDSAGFDGDDSRLDEDASVNTSPSRSGGNYVVIGGSFSLMHNAENFANKLKRKGYSNAYVAKFNSGKFASVIVDSYDSSSEASAMVKELKAAGIEAFSKRKR